MYFVKVIQGQDETDIKRGLVDVVDEQIWLGGDDHNQAELIPFFVKGATIVPGAQQGKKTGVKWGK